MASYPEYKNPDYSLISEHINNYWADNKVFEQSIQNRAGKPFIFFEGPPSANGIPGIHHVMSRTVKDIFCRYKSLQGFEVQRKAGWDTHGLPVELQVEKELGITKDDIGKSISVEEYNAKCREAVFRYTEQWNTLTKQMGYWVDLEKPYITYDNNYIASVWSLLKVLHKNNKLYKGFTIQPYSPAAGTGLSSHELNQPGTYKMVKDTSIVAQFKVIRNDKSSFLFENEENELYFLAWTTTPWTLPANSALIVGEKIEYAKVKTYNPYTHKSITVILAKDLIGKHFNSKAKDLSLAEYKAGEKLIPYEVGAVFKGSELLNVAYEQLMPYIQPSEPAFFVIPGDFVSTEDGTGIVHCSPTFGADDNRVAKEAGIPPILVLDENGKPAPIVDKRGRFVAEITDFAGMFVKNYNNADESDPEYRSTDVLISIKLKEENKAFKVEKYEHSYPHCWRTDKPILYYPMESWFIRTSEKRSLMAELNHSINWKPESTGTGRFGNWLENAVDWNLSRSRYWGTPLPIWRNENGTSELCIGSIEELRLELQKALDSGRLSTEQQAINTEYLNKLSDSTFDLHRPYVDAITLVSEEGEVLKRELDLIDVWFDSGAMPYAQQNAIIKSADDWQPSFQADFIAEGIDQTRGWFYTLHAISSLVFGKEAYKNVIANGLVLDANGNKMSKRLGNIVNPFETLKTYGPDPVRWYMIVNAPPWDNLKFDLEGVKEVRSKYFGTLSNTYSFFALYANLDGFNPELHTPAEQELSESDCWIIARLNQVIELAEQSFENYEPTNATRAIQEFVIEDLSNWYVRLNRKRFWKGEFNEDKKAAFYTLHHCLKSIAQIMAPIAPFFAEQLFLDLQSYKENRLSVHLSDWPQVDKHFTQRYADLLAQTSLAQQVCSLIHALRKKNNLRVRQPLQKALVSVSVNELPANIEAMLEMIKAETNVKEVLLNSSESMVSYSLMPNLPVIGKVIGKQIPAFKALLAEISQEEIAKLMEGEMLAYERGDLSINLTKEAVIIKAENFPGYDTLSNGSVSVGLDITLNDSLVTEGIARDLVNRIQSLRKEQNLSISDRIEVRLFADDATSISNALALFKEYIKTEVQAEEILISPAPIAINADLDEFPLGIELIVK